MTLPGSPSPSPDKATTSEYIVTCPECERHTIADWSNIPPGGVEPTICRCGYTILSETEGDPVLLNWTAAASVRPVPPPEPVGAAEGKPQYLVEDGELQERLDRALLRAREAEARYYAEGFAQGKREERQRLALRFSRFVEAYHHDFCEQSDNPCECGWCLMLKDWNELDLSPSAPSSGTTDQGERK